MPNLNESDLLQEYKDAVKENYPVMDVYILSRLPEGAVKNEPPRIGDVTISEDGANNDQIMADVTDPDSDIAGAEIKVSHRENGGEIVDLDDRQPFGGCSYNIYNGEFEAYTQKYNDCHSSFQRRRGYVSAPACSCASRRYALPAAGSQRSCARAGSP